jgi:hypothetical protein
MVLLAKRNVDQRNLSVSYDATVAFCPWPVKVFRIHPNHLFLCRPQSLQRADPVNTHHRDCQDDILEYQYSFCIGMFECPLLAQSRRSSLGRFTLRLNTKFLIDYFNYLINSNFNFRPDSCWPSL